MQIWGRNVVTMTVPYFGLYEMYQVKPLTLGYTIIQYHFGKILLLNYFIFCQNGWKIDISIFSSYLQLRTSWLVPTIFPENISPGKCNWFSQGIQILSASGKKAFMWLGIVIFNFLFKWISYNWIFPSQNKMPLQNNCKISKHLMYHLYKLI